MAVVKEIHKTSRYYERQGYRVLEIPIEFKGRFELDIQAALMNIAGESISNSMKFLSYENIARCYNKSFNPFQTNIITTGMHDKLTIMEFFKPELVPSEIYTRPVFIHIDTSLTGDKTGISAIAVMGYKNVNEYSIQSGEIETTKELYYHHIFTVGIQCPNGSEISFQKTRDFIYYLKYQLGWNIWGVSTDGFQSADTRQQLITMGFENVDCVSLDKKPDGYLTYKNAVNEQRISHLYIDELEYELVNLNRDNVTGRVDHDIDKCFTGDTKVKLVDGRDLTILELLQEQEYKTNWVYTFNEEKQIIEPKPIKKVFQTMVTKKLVKVTLDNGEIIKCTPNHRFMLRNGDYLEANKLYAGCSLMPLYDKENKLVKSIDLITEDSGIEVYDLEIEDNHNFALSAGVIVHNSKDLSDSLAGAVYNASLHEQDLNLNAGDMFDVIMNVNDNVDEEMVRSENILDNMVSNKIESVEQAVKIINPFNDNGENDSGFFFL